MHNIIRQTTPHVDDSVSKKEFMQILSCTTFCCLKSLLLVVNIVAVAKSWYCYHVIFSS